MSALIAERPTLSMGDKLPDINVSLYRSVKVYKGGIVCVNTAHGFGVPGSAATTLMCLGKAKDTVDNSSGGDGDRSVDVEPGVFHFANSGGGDTITQANVGSYCYIVDDQTVAKTDGTGSRSRAGMVVGVDAGGVWVFMAPSLIPATIATLAGSESLSNKTLVTPTIAATGFTNMQHDHSAANKGGKISAAGVAPGDAYQILRTNAAGTATEMGSPMALIPAADLPAHNANDIIPTDIVSGAIYDIPALDAGSTITLPAAAADGTYCWIRGDGAKNDQTIQIRDATGPVNLTAAVGANKRLLAFCVKVDGAWYASVHVAP